MIKLLRQFAVIPLELLIGIASLGSFINILPLVKAAWLISGQADHACRVIALTAGKKGMEHARLLAQQYLDKLPDCQIAATIAFLEIQLAEDIHRAAGWVRHARDLNCSNPELLLYMELLLSECMEQFNSDNIVDSILSRNDLPMNYTRTALLTKAETYICRRSPDQADQILDYILGIEENIIARYLKWITCTIKNDTQQAKQNLDIFSSKFNNPAMLSLYLAAGSLHLNDTPKSLEYLAQALRGGVKPLTARLMDKRFGQLLETQQIKSILSETG